MMGWLHRILQHNWILKECSGTARGLLHQQVVAEILVPIIGISRTISLMRTPPLPRVGVDVFHHRLKEVAVLP